MKNIDKIIDKYSELFKVRLINLLMGITGIKKWCSKNFINFETIINYTQKYFEIQASYLKIINTEEEPHEFIMNLKQKFSHINSQYTKNKVKTALLFGFPQNIVSKISDTNKYLSLYKPNYQNIFTISAYNPSKPKSFISKEQSSEYLLFLENNIEKDEIMIISRIDINDILLLSYIYTEKFDIDDDKLKFIESKIEKYKQAVILKKPPIEKFRLPITGNETNNTMINYLQTIDKIVSAIKNNENKQKLKINLDFISLIEPEMKQYIKSLSNDTNDTILDNECELSIA